MRGNVTLVKNLHSQIDLSYEHFEKGDVLSSVRSLVIGTRSDLPDTTINYSYNDAGEKVQPQTPFGVFHYERDALPKNTQIALGVSGGLIAANLGVYWLQGAYGN